MLALASDEVDANAVIAVDPSWVTRQVSSKLLKIIGEIDDQTLIMADLSRKTSRCSVLYGLFERRYPTTENSARQNRIYCGSVTRQVTHDYPITVEEATEMGLQSPWGCNPIYKQWSSTQPQGGRPSVQYIPMPYDRRPALLPREGHYGSS